MTISANWYPRNRQALEEFLSSSFDNDYAIFDFDNTLSMGDSQWTLFIGQAERLAYKLSPEEFHALLSKEFTKEEIALKVPSFSFTFQDVIEDIVSSYRFLFKAGEVGFKTKIDSNNYPLEKQEFLTKMLFLLSQVESFLSVDAACRFIQYPFVHLTKEEVYALAQEVHTEACKKTRQKGIRHAIQFSPKEIPSRTGVISIELDEGFIIVDEMLELLQSLSKKGVDLYCISSSQEDTIRAALENPFFHFPPFKGIFTENLLLDQKGRYCEEYDFIGHPPTVNEGKKKAISEKILSLYGKAPIFMAGDSDGDYSFLSSFEEARLILIFNRGQRCLELQKLKEKALKEEKDGLKPHYLVQGRSTTKAQLWPKEECLDSRLRLHLGNGELSSPSQCSLKDKTIA